MTLMNETNSNGGCGTDDCKVVAIQFDGQTEHQPPVTPMTTKAISTNKPEPPFVFAGFLACALSSILLSFAMLFIKLHPANSFAEITNLIFLRGIMMMILSGLTIALNGSSIWLKQGEYLIVSVRSILSSAAPFGMYIALNYISLGDATAIIYSSPVWTSLLSHFILDEPLYLLQIIALPASLLSVVLIAHPGLIISVAELAEEEIGEEIRELVNETLSLGMRADNNYSTTTTKLPGELDDPIYEEFLRQDLAHRWPGIFIALATSFIVSIAYISFRMGSSTPIQTTVFWTGFASCFMTIIMMFFTGFESLFPNTTYEWSLVLGNSFFSWLGSYLVQFALLYENASIVSVVRTFDVVMSFAFSALFLSEPILSTSVIGATIISSIVVLLVLNDWFQNSSSKKKLLLSDKLYQDSGMLKV